MRFILLTFVLCIPLQAQPVVHHNEASGALQAKWDWVQQEGGNETFWAGYRIEKLMGRRAFYGSSVRSGFKKEHSLYALIGEQEKFDEILNDVHLDWRFNGQGFFQFTDKGEGGMRELILKEIAILIQYEDGIPTQVIASNMSMEFRPEGTTVYWVDRAEKDESIGLLIKLYNQIDQNNEKEDALYILGLHGAHLEIERFATGILQNSPDSDIRERAAFILGQQNSASALATLRTTIRNDSSKDVQEKAVYALSQMSLPAAQDLLIDLARNEANAEVRKKAIHGLGQRASQKALEALEESIYNEADADVQKHAVYALAQFDSETALPALIDIANNHASADVRKSAIYMLGDIGNEEAVEALIEIVEKQ